MTKAEIIAELKAEHKKQRAWQRLVNDEELDIELLESLSHKQLTLILKEVKQYYERRQKR